ncbi:MAG: FliM/FliN family flagellar motor switch protein [Planctomycetota bacterium]
MSDLNADLATDLLAACQANAGEIAAALGRALDADFTLSGGVTEAYAGDSSLTDFDDAGLIVRLEVAGSALVVAITESSTLLPTWYGDPDLSQSSKLATLAQELSMLVAPTTVAVERFRAQRVDSITEAVQRGSPTEETALATFELASGERQGRLAVLWPLTSPFTILPADEQPETRGQGESIAPNSTATASDGDSPPDRRRIVGLRQLPGYAQSLLKVRVPVRVQLAARKENVENVVEMAPGAILKFDKACDDLLQLYVGDQAVAEGEAVKIGDKFGFRVTQMAMPPEAFRKVGRTQA